MAVELFIARHGQNEDNANGILNGHRDLPLTDLGREQARQLAQGIIDAGLKFDVIFSSPLSRAYEAAEIVGDKLGVKQKPVVLDVLIERDFGVMTGKPLSSIIELCTPNIIVGEKITYFLNPEGAETFEQLLERGKHALKELRQLAASGRALVVCHGDIGKMIYAAATGKTWREVLTDFHLGNCELIDLEPDGDTHIIKLEQYNS